MSLFKVPKTYSLLSIGQRGVGKTVFLAGSYAEFLANRQQYRSQQLWLDCQERQAQEAMNNLLRYIVQTGRYPPLTASITNFNFSLKQHRGEGEQTLCRFRWWDMPGELCSFDSSEFRQLVFSSHGCCVFIDAEALVYEPDYQLQLDRLMEQVIPIIMLIHFNRLNYPVALLLTKCDSLANTAARQQLQEKIEMITNQWKLLEINHRTFCLEIPILNTEKGFSLQAKGTSQVLLWLLSEIEKIAQKGQKLHSTKVC
ncbi:MAG: hypothetical protein ACFB4I_02100 [Cyanophyceae cyanobacterium]